MEFVGGLGLVKEDVYMQRFLRRGLKIHIAPKTDTVAVNNFWVKPANRIPTCALDKPADAFAEKYPVVSEEIENQT